MDGWKIKSDEWFVWYECSNCGSQPLRDDSGNELLSPFCPICGKPMKNAQFTEAASKAFILH